jgi:hypothetical protein
MYNNLKTVSRDYMLSRFFCICETCFYTVFIYLYFQFGEPKPTLDNISFLYYNFLHLMHNMYKIKKIRFS